MINLILFFLLIVVEPWQSFGFVYVKIFRIESFSKEIRIQGSGLSSGITLNVL